MTHRELLERAVELALEHSRTGHNGPFGAVIARNGEIIAEGWNRVVEGNDPTAHAEIVAVRQACRKLNDFSLKGCTIYTSCEPCPMCLAAVYWSRLDALYYAASGQSAENAGFDDRRIQNQLLLPPEKRSLKCIYLPLEQAEDIFRIWLNNPDRIEY
jgi:tRNA(Arg) A34 adenosine deaminase TadA